MDFNKYMEQIRKQFDLCISQNNIQMFIRDMSTTHNMEYNLTMCGFTYPVCVITTYNELYKLLGKTTVPCLWIEYKDNEVILYPCTN